MPYVHIQVTDEGVTREHKKALVEETTTMLQRLLGKSPATTFVVIEEVPTDNWGLGGELVTDIRAKPSVAGSQLSQNRRVVNASPGTPSNEITPEQPD